MVSEGINSQIKRKARCKFGHYEYDCELQRRLNRNNPEISFHEFPDFGRIWVALSELKVYAKVGGQEYAQPLHHHFRNDNQHGN